MRASKAIEQRLGGPIANISFALMRGYVHSAQRRGVGMMHTAQGYCQVKSPKWIESSDEYL